MTTTTDADKAFKRGTDDLKTSVFKLKFSSDHVSAVGNFEKAAKIYEENKQWDSAIQAYFKAIECNKKLLESWAEGVNYLRIAEINFMHKNNSDIGFKYLKEAQISFKIAGKYHTSLKILTDLSDKLQNYAQETAMNQYSKISLQIIRDAWDDSLGHIDNDMIKVSMDGLYSKLLDSYLTEENMDLNSSHAISEDYIKVIKSTKNVKSHKIINAYAKMLMLFLINKDFSECEGLIDKARAFSDTSTMEDISDLQTLVNSFKDKVEKKFNFQLTYCYHLFERNLLKQLKKAFDKHQLEGSSSEDYLGTEKMVIHKLGYKAENKKEESTQDTKDTGDMKEKLEQEKVEGEIEIEKEKEGFETGDNKEEAPHEADEYL